MDHIAYEIIGIKVRQIYLSLLKQVLREKGWVELLHSRLQEKNHGDNDIITISSIFWKLDIITVTRLIIKYGTTLETC